MCGRYGITLTAHEAMRRLGVDAGKLLAAESKPNYNAAPGQAHPVAIGQLEDPGTIEYAPVHWGFLPSWQDQPSKASINMRLESSHKRYWNKAFCKRRCVIAANWWYEWQTPGKAKQPYAIKPADADGFFLAGIWSVAKGLSAGHALKGQRTFAILTREAEEDIRSIHPRMPVALDDESAREWLEPEEDRSALHGIVVGTRFCQYKAWPVSTRVNKPENNDASLTEAT